MLMQPGRPSTQHSTRTILFIEALNLSLLGRHRVISYAKL